MENITVTELTLCIFLVFINHQWSEVSHVGTTGQKLHKISVGKSSLATSVQCYEIFKAAYYSATSMGPGAVRDSSSSTHVGVFRIASVCPRAAPPACYCDCANIRRNYLLGLYRSIA